MRGGKRTGMLWLMEKEMGREKVGKKKRSVVEFFVCEDFLLRVFAFYC